MEARDTMSHAQCPSCKTTDCERHRLLEESLAAEFSGKLPTLMQSEKYGAAAQECRRRAAKLA